MSIAKTKHVILHDHTIAAKKIATVRLDPDLYNEIIKYARIEHRSISSEIIQLIVEAINCRVESAAEYGEKLDIPDSLVFRDRSKDE
jgi:hypothetical protein